MTEADPGAAPPPVTRELAQWLAALTLDEIPSKTVERAKHLLLDGIGCGLVGAHLPWSDAATDALCASEGAGSARLIGSARTTTPMTAALLNSSYVQGFELDDYHPVAPVHGVCLVLPAMLAAASIPGIGPIDGQTLLLGAIRGLEVSPRVGLAVGGAQMLTRGWHSGPVFGGPGAAAAAGTVFALDSGQMEDAIGLAATQACGLMAAQFDSMGKRMQHGFAARNGLLAATLAHGGYTGIKQVFERPYGGFLAVFGEGHETEPQQISDGLGRVWHTDYIAVKPYAAMAGLHAAIDAARALLAAGPVEPDTVESIVISVSEPAFHHGGWPAERPLAEVGAQMNLQYAVAVTLLDGNALAAQFAPQRIDADDVWSLIDRTTARHEPSFDERLQDGYNTRLEVTLDDGTVRSAFVEQPRGGLLNPLSNGEVVAKFRELTTPLLGANRAREIEQAVLSLERLDDVGKLERLICQPVPALFEAEGGRA
jgi:aconitate decarboxylase